LQSDLEAFLQQCAAKRKALQDKIGEVDHVCSDQSLFSFGFGFDFGFGF
jgi:hypothetical protein